ncbi:hypothetical protein FOA52_016119 [Chlamydomonas sp. UWO 241]|nr:hypothetical protein FOA52_016119 [Chlamydomonas sp. UWO 241]
MLVCQVLSCARVLFPHSVALSLVLIDADSQSQMRVARAVAELHVARARLPVWLRMMDVAMMAAGVCWGVWAVRTFRTADALIMCLGHLAGLALTLSPWFSLEVHCLLPTAWAMCALAVAFAADLAWSRLGTAGGAFVLSPKLAMNSFLDGPVLISASVIGAYKVATVVLCTKRGPSRHAMSGCQAWANIASNLLLHGMLATQAAFGIHIDAALRTKLAIVAAIECAALLLMILLTPKATPTGAMAGKAASASDEQPASPVAPTDAQAAYAAHEPYFGTSAAAEPRTSTDAAIAHIAAVPVAPTAATSDGALQYTSILMSHSVPFTTKFPSLHLADHPHLATPAGLAALRARVERKVSERASVLAGAPMSLRFVTLHVGAGCVVVHGKMIVDGPGGGKAETEMLRAVMASELLEELMPEGAHVLNGAPAVLQLGGGAAPMEMAFVAAGGRFVEAPPRSAPTPTPGVPLLSATCPLLAVPAGGSGCVHLQFATALLARALGNNPELVVTWVPSSASAPHTSLVRERVAALQAAARARGNPPGLIDIDVDLGPRPSHGMFIAQLVDGDALLAAHSVALLPSSAAVVVAELLRARLPSDAPHAVAHDLGVLLCGPRVRAAGDAVVQRRVVLALMAAEGASRPGLPALRALLDGLLRTLDAAGAELEAAPSSSSPAAADAVAAAGDTCPPYNRPPSLWCRVYFIICAVKVAGFVMEGEADAAINMTGLSVPYGLYILADNTRVFARLPRALRGLDACAVGRVYRVLLFIVTRLGGVNPIPRAPDHLKHAGDIGMLLAWSWFERPRSSALGAALALFAELPAMRWFLWHALACCGQATSAVEALTEISLRAAFLIAIHVVVWRASSTPAAGTRAAKLKVA